METTSAEHNSSTSSQQSEVRCRPRQSITGGLILISLGVLFLADNLLPAFRFRDYWPLVLIAIGVALLIRAKR